MMRALFLFLAFSATAFCADDPAQTLAVVKTWADLMAQPPINMEGGGKVHLGIESLSVPAEAAVLVYCLAEDVPLKESFGSATFATTLGPLKLKSSEPFVESGVNFGQMMAVQGVMRPSMEKGRALYVQLAKIDAVLPTVTVLAPSGKVIADARVTVSAEPNHPWTSFALETNRNPKQQVINGFAMPILNQIAEATLVPAVNVTLPRYDGALPIFSADEDGTRKPFDFKDDQRLPTFLDPPAPGAPSEELKKQAAALVLQLDDDDFDVRQRASAVLKKLGPEVLGLLREAAAKNADPEVRARLTEAFHAADGPLAVAIENLKLSISTPIAFNDMHFFQNFAARWWVNGKPVAKTGRFNAMGVDLANQQDFCTTAHIELKQLAQALDAKKGDKIAVEVMFCPDGIRSPTNNDGMLMQRMIMMAAMGMNQPPKIMRVPMRSKKLEFVLP